MKKILVLTLVLLLTLSFFTGCKDTTSETTDADGDTSDVAATDSATTSTTQETEEAEEEGYLKLYFEGMNETGDGFGLTAKKGNYLEVALIWNTLIKWETDTGKMVNLLAEDISANDDHTVYTVKLREDVLWHDGTPFTADDVVFSYNAAMFGYPAGANMLSSLTDFDAAVNGEIDELSSVYATDDYTVVFELNKTDKNMMAPVVNNIFSLGQFAILPEHSFEGIAWADFATCDYWNSPIGTGPYMVNELNFPEYCSLVRFEDYFGEAPGIKNILLTAYTDTEAAYAAALAGDLDLVRNIASDSAGNIVAQNADCEIAIHNASFTRTMMFDVKESAVNLDFKKAEVRQAINLIIDKQAIVDYLGIAASVATNYNNDSFYNTDIPLWERDVAKGVQMLEAAGFDFNKTIQLIGYYTDQATVDIMDIMVSNLADAGITAEYTIDNATCGDQWQTGNFDMMYMGVGSGPVVYSYYGTDNNYETHMNGFESENREFYNEKWAEYSNSIDINERKRICGEIQLQYMEDLYGIPLYFLNTVYLVNTAHLQGYTGISTDVESFEYHGFEDWLLTE